MNLQNKQHTKSQHMFAKVFVVLAVSAGIFFGISNTGSAATNNDNASATASKSDSKETATPVFSQIVNTGTISLKIKTTGEIKPMLGVDINPEAAGKLEEVLVDVGDLVKKGQKLALVNDETQQAQFEQAKAALNVANAAVEMQKVNIESAKSGLVSAKAAVEAADSQLKNLSVTRKRLEKLFAEGAVSRQDVDNIIAQYDNANAAFINAQTNVKKASDAVSTALMNLEVRKAEQTQATANLNAVKVNLAHTIVDAPFDGVITARYSDPGSNANTAKALFSIEQNNPLKILGTVIEKSLPQIEPGKTEVAITVDSVEGEFKGIVKKVYPSIDKISRTGKIEIHLDNSENKIRTGMFAKIDVLVSTHENAVIIPRDALIKFEGGYLAYVVENNRAVKRAVKVGITDDNDIEILEGIKAGDRIISKGIEFVREGSLVSVD